MASKNIIIGPAFPLRGGIANFNEALCKAFQKAGRETEIVSFSLQYPDFLFPGKTQYDETGTPPEFKITSMINSVNPLSWIKTARYIKRQKPDYVIFRYWLPFMGPCLGTVAWLVRKNTNIKVIAITDNVIPHEQRPGDRVFTNYFVKKCDGFVAMSRAVLEDLKQFTDNPHRRFIPHPIYNIFGDKVDKSSALEHLKLNPEYQYLLFFGFIRKYKGLGLLLEAMADPRIKAMKVKLIVAGEFYEDEEYYNNLIKKHGLKEQLLLKTEFIPGDEVKHYFCAADMVVQPYLSATQSGVTQIAYHFDRPMLVTDVGGLAEIVPHQKVGYVCDIEAKSIADAIVDFYQNKREEQFAENVKTEKKRFEWSSMVKGIEELVEELKGKVE